MSRIGKKPISLPSGVTMNVKGQSVEVSGSLGRLAWTAPEPIRVGMGEDKKTIVVQSEGDKRSNRAFHGLTRSIVQNMVDGVSKGFEKKLEVYGTGYTCNVNGKKLQLNVGFMGRGDKTKPQFSIDIPDGIEVNVEVAAARGDSDPAKFAIKGCDKQMVGQFAAQIRKIRPPEPYKGKGIRYHDEHVQRKQGKALAGGR
jgi:large subunit ribosomal protein L6